MADRSGELRDAGRLFRAVADDLSQFDKERAKAEKSGLRRGMHAARNLAIKRFSSRGIGRTIFGTGAWSVSDLRGLVARTRVREVGPNVYQMGLETNGIPALMELGGRTKPHDIRTRNGRALGKVVRHPGSRVPRFPVLESVIESSAQRFADEIDVSLGKLARAVIGG